MSNAAPWLAISSDWMDDIMFDDTPHGVRLAWVCLLCHVKAQGRAGVVKFRLSKFSQRYVIGPLAVKGMIERAEQCGAVKVKGDLENCTVTVKNWKVYQDPKGRTGANGGSFSKTPPTYGEGDGAGPGDGKGERGKPRDEIWDAVCAEWGMNPVTSAEKSRVGKLVRDLRAKGATPDEITARRRRYAKKWPNAADTPEAVVKHWDAFPGRATKPDTHREQIANEQKQRDAEEAAALAKVKAMNDALDALSEAELEALRTKAIARAPNQIIREGLQRATFKAQTLRLAMFNVLNEG